MWKIMAFPDWREKWPGGQIYYMYIIHVDIHMDKTFLGTIKVIESNVRSHEKSCNFLPSLCPIN